MSTSATDSLSQTAYKLTPMTAVLGVQMLFVAFGALVLVLVPLLTGLDPNVALFTAAVGGLSVAPADRALKSIGLASILAVVANLVLPGRVWSKGIS